MPLWMNKDVTEWTLTTPSNVLLVLDIFVSNRQCPYALEAIIALAEMGVTQKEMQPQGQSKSTRLTSDHLDQVRWLQRYADAQCAVACHDYKGGLEQLCQLGQRFPSNLHLTLETAKVEVALGKTGDAMHNFEKARQMDQCNITGMDEYALLLRSKAGHSEMNRLVNDLLDIDAGRPEVWVASAVYWDMREDKERAAAYIDKDFTVGARPVGVAVDHALLTLSVSF
ncbi:hypothetical protein L7F22_068677 [Adiantum nelumboides]|nr:hypothetical protein [Adiantum nelumboides]